MPILEVIACSVADAIEAELGGAGRLEIVRAMNAGGLTPPVSLVREILAAVSIPVRVMLRENAGFESRGQAGIEELCRARVRGLRQLVESAAPELAIIAGGGVDADAIRALRETTSIREFHVGRAARQGADIGQPVDAQHVRRLAALVAG
jgi:copper homeostasis protein